MKEIWKPVIYKGVDYTGTYEASNLGRIRSLRYNKERILGLGKKTEYAKVLLYNNGNRVCCSVHILVWEAFNQKTKCGYVIHHIDSNTRNNELKNLSHITRRENQSIERTIKSGLPVGICICESTGRYRVRIGRYLNKINTTFSLGNYKEKSNAIRAYNVGLSVIKNNKLVTYSEMDIAINKFRSQINLRPIERLKTNR